MKFRPLVLVYGAGEMGTAITHRLFRSRFRVVLSTQDNPRTLMRGNAFSQAIFSGSFEVEGVTARKSVVTEALTVIDQDVIPLLTAESRSVLDVLSPDIVVDARPPSAERELTVGDASLVIGIGDGFSAGVDCDQVINTVPGHDMGRIIYRGPIPEPDTPLDNRRKEITTPDAGVFVPRIRLGQIVVEGAPIATIGTREIVAVGKAVVSAILHEGVDVDEGTCVAELDPGGDENTCYTISYQGRLVSGGVLESSVAWVADVGGYSYPSSS